MYCWCASRRPRLLVVRGAAGCVLVDQRVDVNASSGEGGQQIAEERLHAADEWRKELRDVKDPWRQSPSGFGPCYASSSMHDRNRSEKFVYVRLHGIMGPIRAFEKLNCGDASWLRFRYPALAPEMILAVWTSPSGAPLGSKH